MRTPYKRRRRVIQDEGPDPIDVFVGRRMRERRRQIGISQSEIGGQLGLSFQAVQKYESGEIRIAASTLFRLCHVLGVGPGYFFEGLTPPERKGSDKKRGVK